MNPSEMSLEVLAGLVKHLHQEGMTAYHNQRSVEAHIWFSQCLDVLGKIGQNEEFISNLLYYLGVLYSEDATPNGAQQAVSFFEAAATIERHLPTTQATADTLRVLSRALSITGDLVAAYRVLGDALRMYTELRNLEDTKATQALLAELKQKTDPAALSANALQLAANKSYEFTIQVEKETISQFVIGNTGKVTWLPTPGLNKSIPIGRVQRWQVFCSRNG